MNEYCKLKEEQLARIGFRDNLIFVSLGAFGGLISFSLTDETHLYAMLVIPWVSTILGWTYLINDEKVSAIGRYFRDTLTEKIADAYPEHKPYLGWEFAHRSDRGRRRRKWAQLIVDELTFGGTSCAAVGSFLFLIGPSNYPVIAVVFLDALLSVWMIIEIAVHADTSADGT